MTLSSIIDSLGLCTSTRQSRNVTTELSQFSNRAQASTGEAVVTHTTSAQLVDCCKRERDLIGILVLVYKKEKEKELVAGKKETST